MKVADLQTDELTGFLESGRPNAYIYIGVYRIYVRRGIHSIKGRLRKTLDLGNIQNEDMATSASRKLKPTSIT